VVKMFPLKWDRYRFHRPKFDSHILYVLYLLSYAKAVQDGVFILAKNCNQGTVLAISIIT